MTFNFTETFQFSEDSLYKPSKTKLDTALEWVQLAQEDNNKVSIQYLLQVGRVDKPMIVKHWRQDWFYENQGFYKYNGDNNFDLNAKNEDGLIPLHLACTILLRIKQYDLEICSEQLKTRVTKAITKARIKRNLEFHFPKYVKESLIIANGRDLKPFLGMISKNDTQIKTHLFLEGRIEDSLKIYLDSGDTLFKEEVLTS